MDMQNYIKLRKILVSSRNAKEIKEQIFTLNVASCFNYV